LQGKQGSLLDQPEEALFTEYCQLAVCCGQCRGTARQSVDQGHFAEHAARREVIHYGPADLDIDLAFDDGEKAISRVALAENGLARPEGTEIRLAAEYFEGWHRGDWPGWDP